VGTGIEPGPADHPEIVCATARGDCLAAQAGEAGWRGMTGILYVLGLAGAGVGFVFLVIALAWLLSHRNRGDRHKGMPYESGIDTFGDTWGRYNISFYIYALLFVAFDVEVVFLFLWAIAFRSLLIGGLVSMGTFVVILLLGLAYAWRKGVLTWL
jgi:NADH:ubiquinone oxidoreductase subunit 3 (subunit A)